MKVLVIWSSKTGRVVPFVKEQIDSLNKLGVNCILLIIKGGGIIGYFKSYFKILIEVFKQKPDIIHAHFGLVGFICGFLPFRPVITTFHGSDIMNVKTRRISKVAAFLSSASIFVSDTLKQKAKKKKGHVIPCGVDIDFFKPLDKIESRDKMKLNRDNPLILFGSNKTRPEKNYELAEKSFLLFKNKYPNAELICLNGFNRNEVSLLLNAVDVALLTSKWEGSPQFVKEALATLTPIVATNVGDIEWLFGNEPGHFLADFTPEDIANKIELALDFVEKNKRTNGRRRIINLGLDSETVAKQIIEIYKSVL